MVKYTQTYLTKLEAELKESRYEVRYERGNFKSGYCILEDKKVVVINKFSSLESRIQALIEIINQLKQLAESEQNTLENSENSELEPGGESTEEEPEMIHIHSEEINNLGTAIN